MEFRYEREMVKPARHWLESQGLIVKGEFPTPWGICDLVGASLNEEHVKKRLGYRQRKPIGPIVRVAILRRIPDVKTGRSISLTGLQRYYGGLLSEARLAHEVDRLISGRFVEVTSRGNFRKRNGWMPLHDRIVALELKLSRVDEVLHQAIGNLQFSDESYAGLPMDVARRVCGGRKRQDFTRRGIGIVGLTDRQSEILLGAKLRSSSRNVVLQEHTAECFWRTCVKDMRA